MSHARTLLITFLLSFGEEQACLWASLVAHLVKNLPANAGDARNTVSIPGSGRSPVEGNGNPLQYSYLENPMDWELDHKKAVQQRIDAFGLWCWRRFLRIPWAARRSNQSILKEISPEYSLEGLMLKLQYFGHLMQRTDSFEKTLMLGKLEGRKRRG